MKQAAQAGQMQRRETSIACFLGLCLLQLSADARAVQAADLSDAAATLDLACPLPEKTIEIPDGATASDAALLKARATMLDFDAAITGYTKCLADAEAKLAALRPPLIAKLRELRADRNDAAVARAEQVVFQFNQALQAYRAYVHEIKGPVLQWRATSHELESCYPNSNPRTGFAVHLYISETGEVTDMKFNPWRSAKFHSLVRCIVSKAHFIPGTFDGRPAPGTMSLWLYTGAVSFGITEMLRTPDLLSDANETAIAHDKCVPTDLRNRGVVKLRMSVLPNGRVVSP